MSPVAHRRGRRAPIPLSAARLRRGDGGDADLSRSRRIAPDEWGIVHSRTRRLCRRIADESGSATAEYAIATLAAVGFAGLLVVILRSDAVRGMLTNLIQHALSFSG